MTKGLRTAYRCSSDGYHFDSSLEQRCYETIKRAITDFELPYLIKPHYPVQIKPATALYPAIELKVDFFLCPKESHFTKLKPWLIEVKSNFTLKQESFALRVKMFECWNRAEHSHLILMGEEDLNNALKLPVVKRNEFATWIAYNHKLLG